MKPSPRFTVHPITDGRRVEHIIGDLMHDTISAVSIAVFLAACVALAIAAH